MDKAGLVGNYLCQGKNDLRSGFNFYIFFLAPKIKSCSTIIDCGIIEVHKFFKSFNDSKILPDCSQVFKMIECEKISAMLPKSWKKSFNNAIILPTKMRHCNACGKEKPCDRCNNQTDEN